MCVDPATLFVMATVASSAVSAVANIQSGNAQYVAGMQNVQIAERNAQATEDEKKNVSDAAAIERRRLGERVAAEKGALNAKFADMGLDTQFGTPADLVGDTQRAYEIDRNITGRNEITQLGALDKQQADFTQEASMNRASAKGARTAGLMSAAGSILQGASTVAGRWITPAGGATPKVPVSYKDKLIPVGG